MAEGDEKARDLLGIAPVGRAVEKVAEATVRQAEAFLESICMPASKEFGLLLQDRVRAWRARNAILIAQKTEQFLKSSSGISGKKAPPRLVAAILEHGSWNEAEGIQTMWAGLLASSCTTAGEDESNLIFINLLSQITSSEARILNHVCEKAQKVAYPSGLVMANALFLRAEEIMAISGINDIHQLDRELDHVHELGLIQSGFNAATQDLIANLAPTALALNLYVRCRGSQDPPLKYFGLKVPLTEGDKGKAPT